MHLEPVDTAANSVEFFVHHEDVRRAGTGWTVRQLAHANWRKPWRRRSDAAAGCLTRKATVGLVVEADGHPPMTLHTGSADRDDPRPDRRVRAVRLRPQGRRPGRPRRPARRRGRGGGGAVRHLSRRTSAATDRLPRWLARSWGLGCCAPRTPPSSPVALATSTISTSRASCTPCSPARRSPTPRWAPCTPTTPWPSRASSPCSPPPSSASRRTTGSPWSTPTSPARRWPTASSASSARPSPSSSPRRVAAAADGAAAVWADYEPLTAITDPEAAFDDDAPVIFPAHGSNQAMVVTDADPVDLESQQRRRRARPLRQPAHGRRADGAELLRGGARRRRPDDVLRLDADAAHAAGAARRGARDGARRAARHRSAGRRRLRRQGRRCAPSTRPSPPPPVTSAGPSRGRRRAATTSSRSPTAVARSSTPSSAAGATARSPGCACASSATAVRTPASAPSCRPAPSGCPTARTASRPSSSTSSSP